MRQSADNAAEAAHTIEPELLGVRPRPVVWAKQTLLWRRILWNVSVGVGLVLFLLARRDVATWDALMESGVQTQAEVYDTYTTHSKNGTKYHMRYRFQTDTGTHNDTSGINAEKYATGIGKTFTLTYLPGKEKPVYQQGVATPERRNRRLWHWTIGTFCAVSLCALVLGVYEHDARNQRRLLLYGATAPGLVVSGEITKHKNSHTYWLTYSFASRQNIAHSAKVAVTENIYHAQVWGESVHTVLYDEASPHNNKPYFALTAAQVLGK